MESERMRILKMLQEGRVTPEQANDLLTALEQGAEMPREAGAPRPPCSPRPPGPSGPASVASWIRDGARFGRDIAARVVEGLPQSLGNLADPKTRSNFGKMRLTRKQLSRMADGGKYSNFGHLTVADDVPEDLLEVKIGEYVNFGLTTGPQRLLDILEDACTANFGAFRTPGEAEADEEEIEKQEEA